jgi:hypothetical protein
MNVHANIGLIEAISKQLRDMLGEDFDQETYLDTLDGETDYLDVADALLRANVEDEALQSGLADVMKTMKARHDRIGARIDARKAALLTLMNAADVKKLERPVATVSRRAGSLSVRITDEADLPSQLRRVKTISEPDKIAIKAHLQAGETVPGAELVRGPDGVTIRRN